MDKKKHFTQVISKYLLGVIPVAAILLLSMPLVLGSLYTFIIMLVYISSIEGARGGDPASTVDF